MMKAKGARLDPPSQEEHCSPDYDHSLTEKAIKVCRAGRGWSARNPHSLLTPLTPTLSRTREIMGRTTVRKLLAEIKAGKLVTIYFCNN